MSLFQWPFKRKQYPGIGNPRFVSDIVAANEAVIDAMKALTGLNEIDFAIITGFNFTPGSPGTYSTGIFYLNGSFYFLNSFFQEGIYLAPSPTDTMPQPFSDGNSREIYTLLFGTTTTNPAGASPIFSGNMNQYRIGLKNINNSLLSLQTLFSTLKSAAFANIGTTVGTVAAGDDPRFGYTKAQIDALFALKSNVLQLDNTTVYTPTEAYHPATKAYADAAQGMKLIWLGNISGDGNTVTKLAPSSGGLTVTANRFTNGGYQINHNKGDTDYFLSGFGTDAIQLLASPRTITDKTASGFKVYVSDDGSFNNASFEIAIYQFF